MTIVKLDFLRRLQLKLFGAGTGRVDEAILPELEKLLGHKFADRSLLVGALMHRSYASQDRGDSDGSASNERMEFLGDAVLSLVVNEYLYRHYTNKREGELTKMK